MSASCTTKSVKSASLASFVLVSLYGCAPGLSVAVKNRPAVVCFDPSRMDTTAFERIRDTALERSAVHVPDSGGVRCAEVFQVSLGSQVRLNRAFGGKGWRYGRWWTFRRPGPDSTAYRKDYEICRTWNTLDSLASCPVKPGSRFAIGPGQSAVCGANPGYETTDSLQIFLADPRSDLDTANCRFEPLDWER